MAACPSPSASKRKVGASSQAQICNHACSGVLAASRQTEAFLREIAYAVGFASQAHFSTMFRRVTEMTPGQYRRTL